MRHDCDDPYCCPVCLRKLRPDLEPETRRRETQITTSTVATFEARCPGGCRSTIEEGDEIFLTEDGTWVCAECAT